MEQNDISQPTGESEDPNDDEYSWKKEDNNKNESKIPKRSNGPPSSNTDSEPKVSQEVNFDTSSSPDRLRVKITRPAYTQEKFDEGHKKNARRKKTCKQRLKGLVSHCKCSNDCAKKAVLKHLPFIDILRNYNIKGDLLGDVVAGLTVGIMHIPQGMAYGLLTTLPAVYGLYVSFIPVIIYFFLGTSKHISIGTFAVICLMVGSAVEKGNCESRSSVDTSNSTLTTSIPEMSTVYYTPASATPEYNSTEISTDQTADMEEVMCRVGIATAVTFLAGLIQFGMGLCRLGFVTIYLSDPLTRGLTTGAAMHVFTSQVKHVFGIPVNTYQGPMKLVYTYIDFFSKIAQTNIAALVMACICIVLMALVKELANPKVKKIIKMPIPVELFAVVLGTITSYFWGMEEKFSVSVVGEIPTGIPPPSFPPINRFSSILVDAIGISLVSFAINVSMVKLFAKKHNYPMDSNQELMAYGVTNSVSSVFNCFMSSASLSRSLVQEGVGGKTQVASLFSSCLLLIVLFAIGPLFEQLPKCVLAAIIVVNLKGMFLQFKDLPKLWDISLYDFLTWLVVFTAVVFLDVDMGLAIGIGFCLLTVVFRTQSPYTCLLGRVPSTDIYKDTTVYAAATEIPGLKVFRFEASLYFANTEYFVQKLFAKSQVNPRKVKIEREKLKKANKKEEKVNTEEQTSLRNRKLQTLPGIEEGEVLQLITPDVTHIIIDCTTMGYIDYVGVSTLSQVIEEYKLIDVDVSLAGCKAGIREMLESAGFYENIDKSQLYVTVHDAVLVALEKNPELLHQLKNDSQMALHAESFLSITPVSSRPHINPDCQTREPHYHKLDGSKS